MEGLIRILVCKVYSWKKIQKNVNKMNKLSYRNTGLFFCYNYEANTSEFQGNLRFEFPCVEFYIFVQK